MPLTQAQANQLGYYIESEQEQITDPISLDDSGDIYGCEFVVDDFGGVAAAWPNDWDLLATEPCKLFKTSNYKEGVHGGEEIAQALWQCYFALDSEVDEKCRVVIGGFVHDVVGTNKGLTGAIRNTAQLVRLSNLVVPD